MPVLPLVASTTVWPGSSVPVDPHDRRTPDRAEDAVEAGHREPSLRYLGAGRIPGGRHPLPEVGKRTRALLHQDEDVPIGVLEPAGLEPRDLGDAAGKE